MKKVLHIFAALNLVLIISFQTATACTIIILPLRKQFRAADAVFVGKLVKITDSYVPTEQEKKNIPDYWKTDNWKDANIFSKVTFEITSKWKGELSQRHDFIAVAYSICGCSNKQEGFETGKEYLVYAEDKNFVTICEAKDAKHEKTKNEMRRLDRFWFRTWAEIYPF